MVFPQHWRPTSDGVNRELEVALPQGGEVDGAGVAGSGAEHEQTESGEVVHSLAVVVIFHKDELGEGEGDDGEVEDLTEESDLPSLHSEYAIQTRALTVHGS